MGFARHIPGALRIYWLLLLAAGMLSLVGGLPLAHQDFPEIASARVTALILVGATLIGLSAGLMMRDPDISVRSMSGVMLFLAWHGFVMAPAAHYMGVTYGHAAPLHLVTFPASVVGVVFVILPLRGNWAGCSRAVKTITVAVPLAFVVYQGVRYVLALDRLATLVSLLH